MPCHPPLPFHPPNPHTTLTPRRTSAGRERLSPSPVRPRSRSMLRNIGSRIPLLLQAFVSLGEH
ncbi:hypothetical protein E2C01_065239 [Portunus trituberculatus]|uniref:Uncharacterized protein n=1 Tax=Portunus trituberculatus TaxID=210409 RepID=A0A5B7HLD4_PORTR|nr:hypothetical protein [Portunus trituberculatus]